MHIKNKKIPIRDELLTGTLSGKGLAELRISLECERDRLLDKSVMTEPEKRRVQHMTDALAFLGRKDTVRLKEIQRELLKPIPDSGPATSLNRRESPGDILAVVDAKIEAGGPGHDAAKRQTEAERVSATFAAEIIGREFCDCMAFHSGKMFQ